MRGPFELIGDFYDYHFNYYRNYLHRRITFADYSWDQLYNDTRFNIFRNKDDENVGALIKKTFLLGLTAGIAIAPMKYMIMREFNKIPARKCLPAAAGVVLVGG